LAFALDSPVCEAGDPRVVGLGVMAFYGDNADRQLSDQLHASYVEKILFFVTWLVDAGYKVVLFVGDLVDFDVAERILVDIQVSRPCLGPSAVTISHASSWDELTQTIAPVGAIVATRYHNVLCALRLGKPTISISYGTKNDALMEGMGLDNFCLSIRSFEPEQLIERFFELQECSSSMIRNLSVRNTANRRCLDEQFSDLLPSLLEIAAQKA
jgi:polysaccharide pyruvyl transferase WcaK-like protein